MFRWLRWLGLAATVLLALLLAVGRMGGLAGTMPRDLGVHGGRLKAPSPTPNSVSSQAHLWPGHPQGRQAQIEPLPLRGTRADAMVRLQAVVALMPGAQVISVGPDYLYAQFTTPVLRFVDDAEFWLDPAAGVIQVRSASRLGHGDRGLNRERIEAIRARWAG